LERLENFPFGKTSAVSWCKSFFYEPISLILSEMEMSEKKYQYYLVK
jgi:hypothetical protein